MNLVLREPMKSDIRVGEGGMGILAVYFKGGRGGQLVTDPGLWHYDKCFGQELKRGGYQQMILRTHRVLISLL